MDPFSTTKRLDLNLPGKIENSLKIQTCFFNQWVTSAHLLWDCWRIHGLKLWNLVKSFIISVFRHWKMAGWRKRSNFSKKRQYFWIICVESNLIFYRKKIWSLAKDLDYQILEELINWRVKCSFLTLVQVTPGVQVTPFYGTMLW